MPPRRASSPLFKRWLDEARELFRPGERVGVAVSGGPDSVLLLHFMMELARQRGLVLGVVHFNHRLRGAESDADERFVRGLAETLGIKFHGGSAEVAQVAREKRRNLEGTARELRYRYFLSLVPRGRLDKVATAHTANDQAETVLLRLLRGAGTRGLGGIYPALDGGIIRPFLGLTRAEIEAEIKVRNLEYRSDASNRDLRLRRNKVRHELLPWLKKEFNPRVVALLGDLAARSRDDEDFLEAQARERAHPWRGREGEAEKIPLRPLVEFPPALARRVLRQMILSVRGTLRGVTCAHLESLRRFAGQAQSGRSVVLPHGLTARKEFDWLVLKPESAQEKATEYSIPVKVPGEVSPPGSGVTLRFEFIGPGQVQEAYNGIGAGLDPQRLRGPLVLRNWRAGDRFRPAGSRKAGKLKELFRQRRIPVDERKSWPVLESGKEIVWVRGLPPASAVAASPESREVLAIREEALPGEST